MAASACLLFVLIAAAPASADYLYSTSVTGSINRSNLDKPNSAPMTGLVSGLTTPNSVAVDPNYIYWTEPNITGGLNGTKIGRAKLDGSSADRNFLSGTAPSGVAVTDSYIYWTNLGNASGTTIGRAKLDGTDVNQSFITGADVPSGIAVDDSYIYWTNAGTAQIGRANLDGSNVDQTFTQAGTVSAGIAVNNSHIYWANSQGTTIGRADIDGSNSDDNFITGLDKPFGIALDGNSVYWTQYTTNMIGQADLNGANVNTNFMPATLPFGIAVSPYGAATPPDPPAPSPSPAPAPGTKGLTVETTASIVRRQKASIVLACNDSTRCQGRLKLTTVRRYKRGGKRRFLAVGAKNFSIATKSRIRSLVPLTRGALRLLRTRRSLRVNVTVPGTPLKARVTLKRPARR